MPTPVRFPDDIEQTVRFVEDTPPDEIVARTVDRLKAGAKPEALLKAAAIAVSRSTDLPNDHHGGPVHPIAGIQPVAALGPRLDGDWAFLPVIHSVALANKHVHHPEMGPAIMPSLPGGASTDVDADKAAFRNAVMTLEPNLAERLLVRLLPHCTPGEIVSLLFERAVRWNALDDHYFLYPVYAARTAEALGWEPESAAVILRPAVRFISSNARALTIDQLGEKSPHFVSRNVAAFHRFSRDADALIAKYGLDKREIPSLSDPSEDVAVVALAERIGSVDVFARIPELTAEGLGQGISLDGVAEAMGIGGAMIHMRTDYGNPFDVHLTTGVNARRWVIRKPEVDWRHKLLSLLSWSYSSEIRIAENRMIWPVRPSEKELAQLPERGPVELMDAIEAAIGAHPRKEELTEKQGAVEAMSAGEPTRAIMLLAWQYVRKGYEAEALFRRLGKIICRDDFAEMHTFKLMQAATEEYAASRPAHRAFHLVSATKVAAFTYGIEQTVYEKARARLAV